MGDKDKLGISIPRIVRDLLVSENILSYPEALAFSEILDTRLHGNDWLELYDGTTYNLTFEPERRA